jgi:hypothetical protein
MRTPWSFLSTGPDTFRLIMYMPEVGRLCQKGSILVILGIPAVYSNGQGLGYIVDADVSQLVGDCNALHME